jgi:hypothetical protein
LTCRYEQEDEWNEFLERTDTSKVLPMGLNSICPQSMAIVNYCRKKDEQMINHQGYTLFERALLGVVTGSASDF